MKVNGVKEMYFEIHPPSLFLIQTKSTQQIIFNTLFDEVIILFSEPNLQWIYWHILCIGYHWKKKKCSYMYITIKKHLLPWKKSTGMLSGGPLRAAFHVNSTWFVHQRKWSYICFLCLIPSYFLYWSQYMKQPWNPLIILQQSYSKNLSSLFCFFLFFIFYN